MNLSQVLEAFVLLGLGGGAAKFAGLMFNRLFGRKDAQITDAERMTAISVDLVGPIHKELESARAEAGELRRELTEIRADVEDFMRWARVVKRVLDDNGLPVPPMPTIRAVS